MASRYEVEITVAGARDLKNVNWRHGDLNPYVVAWIDPASKSSTKVAVDGDTNPVWDQKIAITLPPGLPLNEATLYLDVVHAGASGDTKPLVGSARLPLRDVLDEAGVGGKVDRTLKLKRPSGRPHGKLEVKVAVKEPSRYYDSYAPPYGQSSTRDYAGGGYGYGYGQTYAAAPPSRYPYAAPQTGYPYGAPPASAYGAPPTSTFNAPPTSAYEYGAPATAYGQPEEKKKSKFGMGTGLAVGAAAGVLGGLALAEGVDYVEDKIADKEADRVEDDLAYDGYGDDF